MLKISSPESMVSDSSKTPEARGLDETTVYALIYYKLIGIIATDNNDDSDSLNYTRMTRFNMY